MHIFVKKPELAKFIEEQVTSGRFESAEDLVEAALDRLLNDESDEDFDDEAVAAIVRADAQCDRGEGRDIADVAADLRKRASEL
jgi:Arc/MetJ-type ribon-helix-helix transcriptional regulator